MVSVRHRHLDDVQARLGVLQHRQLLVDVHEADLVRVGSLAHQVDHLLEQAGAYEARRVNANTTSTTF